VQAITIAWMSVEATVSLFAAWWAGSPALLAFGGDSAIELFSAVVVLWRFRTTAHENAGSRAAHVAGALLFALAAYVPIGQNQQFRLAEQCIHKTFLVLLAEMCESRAERGA
jgi:hypothetical protein